MLVLCVWAQEGDPKYGALEPRSLGIGIMPDHIETLPSPTHVNLPNLIGLWGLLKGTKNKTRKNLPAERHRKTELVNCADGVPFQVSCHQEPRCI